MINFKQKTLILVLSRRIKFEAQTFSLQSSKTGEKKNITKRVQNLNQT